MAHLNFNLGMRQYLSEANKKIVVILQIETKKGIEHCAEIAAVNGIGICLYQNLLSQSLIKDSDALFIGPNDLASSLLGPTGFHCLDHASSPVIQEATAKVLATTKAAGKFAGHFALSADIG